MTVAAVLVSAAPALPVGATIHPHTMPWKNTRSCVGGGWWRRRELNPRPKMLLAKRLHA